MSKNVLVISTSPRRNGNSKLLADAFANRRKARLATALKIFHSMIKPSAFARAAFPAKNHNGA